jgi:hypothetical protein
MESSGPNHEVARWRAAELAGVLACIEDAIATADLLGEHLLGAHLDAARLRVLSLLKEVDDPSSCN